MYEFSCHCSLRTIVHYVWRADRVHAAPGAAHSADRAHDQASPALAGMTICIDLLPALLFKTAKSEHIPCPTLHRCHCMLTGTLSDGYSSQILLLRCCRWAPACSSCQRRQRRCTARASPASACPLYCAGTPPSLAVSQLTYWRPAGQQPGVSCHSYGVCLHAFSAWRASRGCITLPVRQSHCGKWFAGYWMSFWELRGLRGMLCHAARSCCLWTCMRGIVRCSRH